MNQKENHIYGVYIHQICKPAWNNQPPRLVALWKAMRSKGYTPAQIWSIINQEKKRTPGTQLELF